MSRETVFINARIVTRDAVVEGHLRVRDGRIADFDDGWSAPAGAVDCEGDYLIPGLVDIHTDNLEKHLEPRPGVRWPITAALVTHDRQMIAAGITSVFDSLCVGELLENKAGRKDALLDATLALETAADADLLKADHRLHLRCEVTSPDVVEAFSERADDPFVRLVSLMDHTPGQRQWTSIDAWRRFYSKTKTPEQLDAILENRKRFQAENAEPNRTAITEICRQKGLPLASHDDTLTEHVAEAAADGIAISEFPTTTDAARAAQGLGLKTVMGAPNVVRGGSHSGNVSALELAEKGLLDGLASDYVPVSMLHGAFLLHEKAGMALPDAIATVSANPADMVGLDDRGRIEPGRRADLVRVMPYHHVPVVRGVWRDGEMVG